MKITKETISKLNELGYDVWSHDDNCNEAPFEKGSYIYINYRSIKTPKQKEVTVEWLLDRINQESSYRNLSNYLRKLFSSTMSVYPASYGIGVDSLYGLKNNMEKVESTLKNLGLKYRCEFSDCRFVYRFIVSKDRENMRILESLKSA
ncbi:hypothetical protein [Barnesiella intestinihominis]